MKLYYLLGCGTNGVLFFKLSKYAGISETLTNLPRYRGRACAKRLRQSYLIFFRNIRRSRFSRNLANSAFRSGRVYIPILTTPSSLFLGEMVDFFFEGPLFLVFFVAPDALVLSFFFVGCFFFFVAGFLFVGTPVFLCFFRAGADLIEDESNIDALFFSKGFGFVTTRLRFNTFVFFSADSNENTDCSSGEKFAAEKSSQLQAWKASMLASVGVAKSKTPSSSPLSISGLERSTVLVDASSSKSSLFFSFR